MCCPFDGASPCVNKRRNNAALEESSHVEQHQSRRRRVSFDDHVHVLARVTPRSSITRQERERRWYQKSDYRNFKTSTTDLCRRIESDPKAASSETDFCLRGLEKRISNVRQRLKSIAIRDILEAQKEGRSPQYIAMIAKESSSWATDMALETATNDHRSAHCPHLEQSDEALLEALLHDEDKENMKIDSTVEQETFPNVARKRKRSPMQEEESPPPRKRRQHPKKRASSPTTLQGGGWRSRRVPMWTPESWVTGVTA